VAYIRYRPQTVAIDRFLLSLNFAVVLNFNVFPFPSSKPQFLGHVSMNVRPCYKYFMFFCVMEVDWREMEMIPSVKRQCALRKRKKKICT
jgi:hypothetical protein